MEKENGIFFVEVRKFSVYNHFFSVLRCVMCWSCHFYSNCSRAVVKGANFRSIFYNWILWELFYSDLLMQSTQFNRRRVNQRREGFEFFFLTSFIKNDLKLETNYNLFMKKVFSSLLIQKKKDQERFNKMQWFLYFYFSFFKWWM